MPDQPLTVLVAVELSEASQQAVREAVGSDRYIYAPDPDTVAKYIDEADVIFGMPKRELVAKAARLRWLQTHFAGVDIYCLPEPARTDDWILTNATGIYGTAGAEHVMGWMLMFTRGLLHFYRLQQQNTWSRDIDMARKLEGQTLGIVGLGDIGTALAKRAKAFGMKVLAIRRRVTEVPDYVDALWTMDRLPDLLEQSDHVALTLPLTAETRGIIDADMLARMRKTAYLYNIGRGALIDEDALVQALAEGKIAGAGLDVFVEEPLPADSPLWNMPNVLITPHLGADSPWDYDEATKIFIENLGRFRRGEPLKNVVDPARGY